MTSSDLDRLVELTKDARFCMLTTVDGEGTLVSRPMTRQDVDLGVVLWFIATRDSRKVEHVRARPEVNVTVSSDTSWVSIAGRAEVVDDTAKLRELWSTFAEAWLPGGPEDPDAVLIKVDADSAEYWDNPGGRVATVISLVTSKVTGQPYDGGDHAVVDGL
ncbi:MAG: pyridoxamine 5'-phosphate oxidase family protein [Aeromicrobium erythreum]